MRRFILSLALLVTIIVVMPWIIDNITGNFCNKTNTKTDTEISPIIQYSDSDSIQQPIIK
ncbi:MAG: hypothetical protein PHR45_01405 [Muribaculaceae bacterium]|nr:hypothetical protein [Muribaculaceae bacterium]